MLIELKIKNFLSFKDEVKFSMLKSRFDSTTLTNNFISKNNLKILKSAVIFGPNASGKTNLLHALAFLRFLVLESKNFNKKKDIKYLPFKLNTKCRENNPIELGITFIINKNIYVYEIKISKNQKIDKNYKWIITFEKLSKNKKPIFERDSLKIKSQNKKLNKTLEDLQTNKNALFLSKSEVLGLNENSLTEAFSWFNEKLIIDLNSEIDIKLENTLEKISKSAEFKEFVLKYLNRGDFGNIKDIKVSKNKIRFPENFPEELRKTLRNYFFDIKFMHYDNKHKLVDFDFKVEESRGTIKFLSLLGPIYDIIKKEKILVVDEIDKSLHPEILKMIFEIVHTSKSATQIISTTHSFPLLMYVNNSEDEVFRRDQIWFTRKNNQQATDIYSLINIGGIRKDLRIFKAYFDGRLDAFPNVK